MLPGSVVASRLPFRAAATRPRRPALVLRRIPPAVALPTPLPAACIGYLPPSAPYTQQRRTLECRNCRCARGCCNSFAAPYLSATQQRRPDADQRRGPGATRPPAAFTATLYVIFEIMQGRRSSASKSPRLPPGPASRSPRPGTTPNQLRLFQRPCGLRRQPSPLRRARPSRPGMVFWCNPALALPTLPLYSREKCFVRGGIP